MDREEIKQIAYDFTTSKGDAKKLEERILSLFPVSHCYYQVVYNSYDDNIEEVTSPLPTLDRAKKALEANKAYFDEDMYIIAKVNCG